jgi:hypothetical protein
METAAHGWSLRMPAALLLLGQLGYIVVTQFHPGIGETATNHPDVFTEYAGSASWTAVHLGQFLAEAILLSGLLGLFFALDPRGETGRWASRFGAGLAVAALALYGALQAVDGIANYQADRAWVGAPDAEKAARFASAEGVRWIEWGLRSYQDIAVGLALLLFAIAVVRVVGVPALIALFMALTGVAYLAQGWVVGSEGFSPNESLAIIVSWVLAAIWMIWLLVVALRQPQSPRGADSPA